jgi:putative NADPH-quinone reductase
VRVLVVHAHPSRESLSGHLLDRVLAGLGRAGHAVDVVDLYREGFEARMSAEERALHLEGPERKPWLEPHASLLRRAEAIVWVYPTWWSGPPAVLKGWIDRIWTEGVAYTYPPGARRLRPGLRNVRTLAVVTTHGSSRWVNRLEGEVGRRLVLRGLRVLCHPLCRRRWIALYGVDRASPDRIRRFADRVEEAMAAL